MMNRRHIGLALLGIAVWFWIGTGIIWFRNPELTSMQLFQQYWGNYLIILTCATGGGWLVSK